MCGAVAVAAASDLFQPFLDWRTGEDLRSSVTRLHVSNRANKSSFPRDHMPFVSSSGLKKVEPAVLWKGGASLKRASSCCCCRWKRTGVQTVGENARVDANTGLNVRACVIQDEKERPEELASGRQTTAAAFSRAAFTYLACGLDPNESESLTAAASLQTAARTGGGSKRKATNKPKCSRRCKHPVRAELPSTPCP